MAIAAHQRSRSTGGPADSLRATEGSVLDHVGRGRKRILSELRGRVSDDSVSEIAERNRLTDLSVIHISYNYLQLLRFPRLHSYTIHRREHRPRAGNRQRE